MRFEIPGVLKTLVGDALELGRSGEGMLFFSNFKLANFLEETLVEILDLTDTAISEKLKKCKTLMQFKDTLAEKGVDLSIDETLWTQEICQDETKVKQILRNLLSNALKYRKTRVEVSVDRQEDFIVLSVKDDGAGIPVAYHKKIFECYFQLDVSSTCSVRGHGLGLAGVMVLVEDLGGEMLLDSDEGAEEQNSSSKYPSKPITKPDRIFLFVYIMSFSSPLVGRYFLSNSFQNSRCLSFHPFPNFRSKKGSSFPNQSVGLFAPPSTVRNTSAT